MAACTHCVSSLSLDTELGFIRATDPDSDPDFTSLTYTLVTDPSDEGLFSINSTTVRYTH